MKVVKILKGTRKNDGIEQILVVDEHGNAAPFGIPHFQMNYNGDGETLRQSFEYKYDENPFLFADVAQEYKNVSTFWEAK